MKLSKNMARVIVIMAIILTAFTAVVFILPFVKNLVFVVSYIFAVISIAAEVLGYYLSFENGEGTKSKYYGCPVIRVSTIYLIAQLAVSFISICLSLIIPLAVMLIVSILLLCAAAVGLIVADAVREEVEKQEVKIADKTSAMKTLKAKMSVLASKTTDRNIRNLADAVKYSDPVSSAGTEAYESELIMMCNNLSDAVDSKAPTDEICKKMTDLLTERNAVCRNSK